MITIAVNEIVWINDDEEVVSYSFWEFRLENSALQALSQPL